jgi:hypothetical protein
MDIYELIIQVLKNQQQILANQRVMMDMISMEVPSHRARTALYKSINETAVTEAILQGVLDTNPVRKS